MREHAEKYRAMFKRYHIDLRLVPSLGTVENLKRLTDPASRVQAGFVAGGLPGEKELTGLVSLGTVFYDPIWIFCRGLPRPIYLLHLRGRRVAIGPEGGGTRPVMQELFQANDLVGKVTELPLTPGDGGEALLRGEIDCACMLTGAAAPIVRRLLDDESISLVTFPRADAYASLYPHFRKLVVPRGVGSLARDLPPEDVTVLAAMTSLVVREDLHRAIQFLFLSAANDIHSAPGLFARPGQFPAAEPVDFPLSDEAHTFYKSGGTFLQRQLPFWLGVFAQRLLLVLVPIAGILYPLVRMVPTLQEWRAERRLRPFYVELRSLEARLVAGEPGTMAEIDALARRVDDLRVPKTEARFLYTLKQHIELVRERGSSRWKAEP